MPATVSLGRTLVLAALFHAGLFAIVSRANASTSYATLVEPMKLVWIEATPEVEPSPAPGSGEGYASSSDPSRAAPALPQERIKPAVVPMASAIALPDSAPISTGEWTLHITSGQGTSAPGPTLAELGLDGKNHFLGSRGGIREATPDPDRVARERGNRAAGGAMREALHDKDVALGMGGGGPVVTALEEAFLAGTAPLESHAVLVAIADATGVVIRVDVESFSDDLASFRAIADDVLSRLRDKRVRVPVASHGLSMRIDVSSRLALPSGAGPAGVGYDPRHVGMNFDMSDVGAHVGRIVHARILGEELL
jgi:hypothetical protein